MMDISKFKRIYKNIMLIIVVALITFVITSVFLYKKLGNSGYALGNLKGINSELIQKIYTMKSIIDSEYISDIDEQELINGAIRGYVQGLGDEYTEYFTKEEMDDFKADTEGEYVGIGIYMYKNTVDNTIEVLYPIENSPAEEAGLQYEDIIRKVDGVEYTGNDFDTISNYIKGKEGTKVNIEIERDGKRLNFEIERRNIDLYPIKHEILDDDIGYISITSFDVDCAKEFKTLYKELSRNNIKSLIIDLRNNGGGIVEEALEIADYVLEKEDVILITIDKEGNEKIEKSNNKPIINIPVVVLINGNTASASEIIAGALKENDKATIVGEKTYGKGVIQELITLPDGSGIKITTEEYYTPNKNKINKVGIEPNEKIDLPEDVLNIYEVDRNYDTQLQKAIEILKNK